VLELLAFLVTTVVLPVIINKSTEGGRFNWAYPHLRRLWTAIFAFYSFYILQKPGALEIIMKAKENLDTTSPILGYAVCAVVGALLLCGYWWFAGKLFADSHKTPTLYATASKAEYPPGTTLGQIPWSRRFTDLRVSLLNSGPTEWTDIDLIVTPDAAIAAMGQITSVPNIVTSPVASTNQTFQIELVNRATGKRTANPLVLIASEAGYRVQCPKLAARQRIELVIALAGIPDYDSGPPTTPRSDFGVFDRDYAVRLKQAAGSNWYGHGSDANGRIEEVYSQNRPIPKVVRVEGKYQTAGLERVLSQQPKIHDLIGEAIPLIP
jgi:hypothetical protein